MSDVALACLKAFVEQLVADGVTHAWVCPGSRSTSIALALARTPQIKVHVTLDERSAGFSALGAAKASGRPAVVACTSGTAAANIFPAVIEASMSRVPLIVMTADRPDELRNTGANQTIDQVRLYGDYARFVETGVPYESAGAGKYWRTLASAASAYSGPTQLNVALREPLLGTGTPIDLGSQMPDPTPEPPEALPAQAIEIVTKLASTHPEGIIIACGMDGDQSGLIALSNATGWPLIAEPMSGLRRPDASLSAGQTLASSVFMATHRPEVVVAAGDVPVSRALQKLCAEAVRLVTVDRFGRPRNPYGVESIDVHAAPGAFAKAVAEAIARAPVGFWTTQWEAADRAVREAYDNFLDQTNECFEPRIARDLAALLPDASTLIVGASMPVRDLDYAMQPRTGLRVLSNRGASGIDGFVSTVRGVRAVTDGPVVGLCGDLTFLHDASGLLWRDEGDIVMVVINNSGGAIFDLLPQASLPEHERLFVTPHGVDLQQVSAAAGAGHRSVTGATDLEAAVREALAAGGLQVVEVLCDRATNAKLRAQLREAVDLAVS